jgi:hypothetical protein
VTDCTSYTDAEGVSTIAYSRGQNEGLNTRLVYRRGELERIFRNGIEIQVFKDEESGAFWIGSPPRRGIGFPDGYTGPFAANGRRFFVVSVGDKRFIEELE